MRLRFIPATRACLPLPTTTCHTVSRFVGCLRSLRSPFLPRLVPPRTTYCPQLSGFVTLHFRAAPRFARARLLPYLPRLPAAHRAYTISRALVLFYYRGSTTLVWIRCVMRARARRHTRAQHAALFARRAAHARALLHAAFGAPRALPSLRAPAVLCLTHNAVRWVRCVFAFIPPPPLRALPVRFACRAVGAVRSFIPIYAPALPRALDGAHARARTAYLTPHCCFCHAAARSAVCRNACAPWFNARTAGA